MKCKSFPPIASIEADHLHILQTIVVYTPESCAANYYVLLKATQWKLLVWLITYTKSFLNYMLPSLKCHL